MQNLLKNFTAAATMTATACDLTLYPSLCNLWLNLSPLTLYVPLCNLWLIKFASIQQTSSQKQPGTCMSLCNLWLNLSPYSKQVLRNSPVGGNWYETKGSPTVKVGFDRDGDEQQHTDHTPLILQCKSR